MPLLDRYIKINTVMPLIDKHKYYAAPLDRDYFNAPLDKQKYVLFLKGTVHLFGFFHGKLNSPCAVEWY